MIRTYAVLLIVTLTLVGIFDVARADEAPSAADIVAAADGIRNPQNPFRLSLVLVEYQRGEADDSVGLAVHSKIDPSTRQYRNLVRYTAQRAMSASSCC